MIQIKADIDKLEDYCKHINPEAQRLSSVIDSVSKDLAELIFNIADNNDSDVALEVLAGPVSSIVLGLEIQSKLDNDINIDLAIHRANKLHENVIECLSRIDKVITR